MWFVSRRRYDAEITALRAETDRLRLERDAARAERNAFRTSAATTSELYNDASIVNECLTLDLTRVWKRVEIARRAAARILAAYTAERHRADRLQTRLDDACGLHHPAVAAGRYWQDHRTDKTTKEANPS